MELQSLGGLIGLLNWLAKNFHPEISFQICEIKDALTVDIKSTNKTAKFIQPIPNSTVFPLLGRRPTTIKLFADETFYKLLNSSSQARYCFCVMKIRNVKKHRKSCQAYSSNKGCRIFRRT